MLGHLGFSYVGLAYLVMLFTPNILWARPLPAGYDSAGERRALVALERIGQVGYTACALCFADFNLKPLSPWSA